MTGSWKGRGNQYIQFIRVLYCKLPTNGKQANICSKQTRSRGGSEFTCGVEMESLYKCR